MGMLEGKVAVIYGAAGGVGGAVARAFVREGASVFLAGRTLAPLQLLATELTKAGGVAEAGTVDATDPGRTEDHLQSVLRKAGRLDISCNLISTNVKMGALLTKLTEPQFSEAAFTRARSNFVTATAAARIMEPQGRGVILGITAITARIPRANQGGFAIGGAAIEALLRQLALEVGPAGVRVVCLRTHGTPDNPVLDEVFSYLAKQAGTTKEAIEKQNADSVALKRLPRLAEVANAMVLIASDYASTITATAVNASCGDVVD